MATPQFILSCENFYPLLPTGCGYATGLRWFGIPAYINFDIRYSVFDIRYSFFHSFPSKFVVATPRFFILILIPGYNNFDVRYSVFDIRYSFIHSFLPNLFCGYATVHCFARLFYCTTSNPQSLPFLTAGTPSTIHFAGFSSFNIQSNHCCIRIW